MTRAITGSTRPIVGAAAVALRIADFLVSTETERLRLFRLHLLATVQRVSPLLTDLAVLENVAIADAVRLIYPPQDWPWRPLYDFPPAILRRAQQRGQWLGAKSRNEQRQFERAFANPGVIVRPFGDPRGRFAIRPNGAVLGFTAEIGSALLSAFGSTAMLKLAEPIPETLMMAMPGRMLGQVIDHPLFAGRDYTIRRAMPDLCDGLPVLAFGARMLEFQMPLSSQFAGDG